MRDFYFFDGISRGITCRPIPTLRRTCLHRRLYLLCCCNMSAGFRLVNTKCMMLVDMWKKIQHSNAVTLREVFTTKAFGDHCTYGACLRLRRRHRRRHSDRIEIVFLLQRWCFPTTSTRVQKRCSADISTTQQQTRTSPRGSGVSLSSHFSLVQLSSSPFLLPV